MREGDISRIKRYATLAGEDFDKLAHFVYRLGATRFHANTVVEAMIKVPSLQRISQIRYVKPPEVVPKTIDSSHTSPLELLYEICADSASHNPLQFERAFNRLVQLDPPLTRPIHAAVVSQTRVVTRVHAELQIADTFSRSADMEFVDNDKYIGCSKPACYFCYNWFCNHKHRYVPPATHHKIITGCRGPDQQLNEAGAMVLIDMYSKMSRQIGQDIFQFLQQDADPRSHYMSTEASSVTQSVTPSLAEVLSSSSAIGEVG
jgi:hypothetical protein